MLKSQLLVLLIGLGRLVSVWWMFVIVMRCLLERVVGSFSYTVATQEMPHLYAHAESMHYVPHTYHTTSIRQLLPP